MKGRSPNICKSSLSSLWFVYRGAIITGDGGPSVTLPVSLHEAQEAKCWHWNMQSSATIFVLSEHAQGHLPVKGECCIDCGPGEEGRDRKLNFLL